MEHYSLEVLPHEHTGNISFHILQFYDLFNCSANDEDVRFQLLTVFCSHKHLGLTLQTVYRLPISLHPHTKAHIIKRISQIILRVGTFLIFDKYTILIKVIYACGLKIMWHQQACNENYSIIL